MQAPTTDADAGNVIFAQRGQGEGSSRDEASDGGEDDGCGPVLLTSRARARCRAHAACDASALPGAFLTACCAVLAHAFQAGRGGQHQQHVAGDLRRRRRRREARTGYTPWCPARPCHWTAAVLARPLFARGRHGESERACNDNVLASILSTVHTALGGRDPFTGRSLDLQSDDSGRADVISMIHKVPLSGLCLWPVPFP